MPSTSLKPIPAKPKLSHAMFVRLDDDLHQQVRRAADEARMPMAHFARAAIQNQLEAQEQAA